MSRRIATASALALVASLVASSPASASSDAVADARADYDAAAAAYDRREYAVAAARFARADALVPNARTLQLAMASALLASDAALAMNLADRAEARPPSPVLAELSRKIRAKHSAAAGRIRFACPPPAECRATVDGERVDAAHARWVSPGRHQVELADGDARVAREVRLAAGDAITITLQGARAGRDAEGERAPGVGARDETAHRAGISPAFFWTGLGLTGAAVVAATAFTVETANRHGEFVARPSLEAARAGEGAQLRARVAWGAAGALAVATVAAGVFADFGPARVGLGPGALFVAGELR